MDTGRVVYRLTQLYVTALLLVGVLTVGWIFVPRVRGSVQVAGLWFGLAGFGLLVGVTFLLLQVTR